VLGIISGGGRRRKWFCLNVSVHTMKKVLARVVEALPESAQAQIRDRYWQVKSRLLYQILYRVLDLEHTLQSGLTVKVASKGEWWTYNDIFVDGEYDVPIRTALKGRSPVRPFIVLDLGANVGYFAFRVLDLIGQQEWEHSCPDITMIEGSPKTFLELEKRIRSQRQLEVGVRMVHGLVGQPRGSGVIREGAIHVKNTIVDVPVRQGVRVDFVDLDSLMGDKSEIDLLKCDIEGAELLFIQNYADLLRKVKHAVFELHHDQCDTKKCVRALEDLGLRQTILRANSSFSVSLFSRN
jgi:FkbM family methyltransferase